MKRNARELKSNISKLHLFIPVLYSIVGNVDSTSEEFKAILSVKMK